MKSCNPSSEPEYDLASPIALSPTRSSSLAFHDDMENEFSTYSFHPERNLSAYEDILVEESDNQLHMHAIEDNQNQRPFILNNASHSMQKRKKAKHGGIYSLLLKGSKRSEPAICNNPEPVLVTDTSHVYSTGISRFVYHCIVNPI